VLYHAYPEADVPVVQLSLDGTQPGAFHYELGKQRAPLREQDVLVIGSGNVVHNLRLRSHDADSPAQDWAERFNNKLRDLIERREHAPLVAWESMGEDARLAIPTTDHYFPLLYCLALQRDDEPTRFAIDGIEEGSLGMLSVLIGG
jgi:4,5-DOPA dioxygenase extradiol